MTVYTLPTVEEELNAKALECLTWLTNKRDRSEMDGACFSIGLQAMFMCVSGLLDEEVFDLVSQAQADRGEINTHVDRQVLHKNGDFIVIGRLVGNDKLLVTKHVGASEETQDVMYFSDASSSARGQKRLIEMLQQRGYKRA